MRSLIPLLCLTAACGGSSSNSLSGVGSFSPNASNALHGLDMEGNVEQDFIEVILGSFRPFNCSFADAGIPASVLIQGEVDIFIALAPTLQPGTYAITDPQTFFSTPVPAAGFAAISVSGPTSPPSNQDMQTESSATVNTGTLKLTKVGTEWAGSFTATMDVAGSIQSTLSGSFDTSTTCPLEPLSVTRE